MKWDLIALIEEFARGKINIARLNYVIITLVPKTADAKQIQKFRPICLLNVSFKIITKVLMNRLNLVAADVISPVQTAFIKGRFILECVVMAHEVIHEIHRYGSSGLILKLDYEKGYDRVSWDFLKEMLLSRGFGSKWVGWVMSTIHQGTFQVRINDTNGPQFAGGKGLKQGDPIHPCCLIWWLMFFLKCCRKLLIIT